MVSKSSSAELACLVWCQQCVFVVVKMQLSLSLSFVVAGLKAWASYFEKNQYHWNRFCDSTWQVKNCLKRVGTIVIKYALSIDK